MNKPTPEQQHIRLITSGFQTASERAQRNALYARAASRRGKKFKNVFDVELKENQPYFIRRAWKNEKNVLIGVDNPVLALWQCSWNPVEGVIPLATGTFDTIQVWS